MNFSSLELRFPPVVVVAVAAWLMWALAFLFPDLGLAPPGRQLVAAASVVAGVAIAIAGVAAFRRHRTTVNPLRPESASSLVVTGIYHWTRNPMYLGFALALLGWGIYLANPVALGGLFAYVAYMNRFQIGPEERALEARFGEDFKTYCARVGRWL